MSLMEPGLVLICRLVFTGGEVTIDRREWRDRAGLGFELGELGYKSLAPIRPLLVA